MLYGAFREDIDVVGADRGRPAGLATALALGVAVLVGGDRGAIGSQGADDRVLMDDSNWGGWVRAAGEGLLPGVGTHYDVGPDISLHLVRPLSAPSAGDGGPRRALGRTKLGIQFRFLAEDPEGLRPSISAFSLVLTRPGDGPKGSNGGETRVFVPYVDGKGPRSLERLGRRRLVAQPGQRQQGLLAHGLGGEAPGD
jgi:hypothetical protein